jgi:hypothetical protein
MSFNVYSIILLLENHFPILAHIFVLFPIKQRSLFLVSTSSRFSVYSPIKASVSEFKGGTKLQNYLISLFLLMLCLKREFFQRYEAYLNNIPLRGPIRHLSFGTPILRQKQRHVFLFCFVYPVSTTLNLQPPAQERRQTRIK